MTSSYTFYSYKGGSGRTTTCMNTVQHLITELKADKDHPILIVDADLESAGLTHFFDCRNKFVHYFNDSIHATRVFADGDMFDMEIKEETILKREKVVSVEFSESEKREKILNHVSKIGEGYYAKYADKLFSGVSLLRVDWNILEVIFSVYARQTNFSKDEEKIIKHYEPEILLFLSDLLRIEKSNSADKETEKQKKVEDFLPATGVVDVSKYFNCDAGTVRFIGVDVHYEGAQVIRGAATTSAIRGLVGSAQEQNYAAVVFDSGAGTQSTAEAFHKVSDVLVYCMRPTKQFRVGTENHLANQEANLTKKASKRGASYKPVIILPTAVPILSENDSELLKTKRDEALQEIDKLLRSYGHIADGTFCTEKTVLNEVALFKWEERILRNEDDCLGQEDLQRAYNTYKRLAEKLAEFSSKV